MIYVPPGARTGDNVMFATKVMAPIDGPVRENVGLLGSPAFEIPRASPATSRCWPPSGQGAQAPARPQDLVQPRLDRRADRLALADRVPRRLRLRLDGGGLWRQQRAGDDDRGGRLVALSIAAFILIERASLGFGRLKPEIVTVYDPAFWRVERHWKLSDNPLSTAFAGTPMRNVILRLLGVKVGKRVFDDGCNLSERTLVEIGDKANLNADSTSSPIRWKRACSSRISCASAPTRRSGSAASSITA